MNQIFTYLGCSAAVFALFIHCTPAKNQDAELNRISVLTFNIPQGGHDAGNVSFPNRRFDGSRFDELARIISTTKSRHCKHSARQDYDNQFLVRIDRVYFNTSGLTCTSASLMSDANGNGEIKLNGDWPSDHWAVVAKFELN